jgi:hypothetical protein
MPLYELIRVTVVVENTNRLPSGAQSKLSSSVHRGQGNTWCADPLESIDQMPWLLVISVMGPFLMAELVVC